MKNLFDAFISYGRADSKAFATKLHGRLLEEGFKIWFDQNDIPRGVDFQNQIDDGIEKAHNFLFIIAPHSVNSPYCGKEIELALKRNKRIIPLLHVEQISQETWQQRFPKGTPQEWEAYKQKGLHSSFPNMHTAIGKINWVYFREGIDDFEKSFAGLIDLFRRHAAYVEQHTRFLAKALEWYAASLNKRFVTLLHREVNSSDLHPELAKVQWIDFNQNQRDFNANFNQLVRTLDTDREHVQSHTKWLQRAIEWEQKNKSSDLLLRGNEYVIAQNWLQEAEQKNKRPAATPLQKEFIEASQNAIAVAEEEEKRRQSQMLRLQEERTKEAEARLAEQKKSAKRQKFWLSRREVDNFFLYKPLGFLDASLGSPLSLRAKTLVANTLSSVIIKDN